MLYVGTDDGRLHVTRDDGETWTELSETPILMWSLKGEHLQPLKREEVLLP
ncbi:MAG: hypothetical protein R2744_02545 [Bacteroidales bacterium]